MLNWPTLRKQLDKLWVLTWVLWSHCRYEEQTWWEGSIHTSTVRVVNVSAAWDYAVFSCTARNSLGEDRLDIQLVSTSSCFFCVDCMFVRAYD